MAIHQIVVAASPGDAVTNAALEIRQLLRRIGPSDVFARYVDPQLVDQVFSIGRLATRRPAPGDALVYHASIGEPEIAAFLLDRPETLVLVYHNITPAQYFAILDPRFAQLLAIGRVELALLRNRVSLALAVSAYNATELEALGYREVRVSPLALDLSRLPSLGPDAAMVERLAHDFDGPLVLFVGQLLPHKRPDLLVEAYHVLCTYLLPDAQMALVGPSRLERYRRALEELIEDLSLRTWITGWLRDGEVATLYRRASCFVTMSEHEGVCVPLLEAMAFDVPVIARDFAAIPETMSGAGILLPPQDNPVLVAEAINELITNAGLRDLLVERGRDRVDAVDPEVARATFLSHIAEVV